MKKKYLLILMMPVFFAMISQYLDIQSNYKSLVNLIPGFVHDFHNSDQYKNTVSDIYYGLSLDISEMKSGIIESNHL
jgi:hypothetical protein